MTYDIFFSPDIWAMPTEWDSDSEAKVAASATYAAVFPMPFSQWWIVFFVWQMTRYAYARKRSVFFIFRHWYWLPSFRLLICHGSLVYFPFRFSHDIRLPSSACPFLSFSFLFPFHILVLSFWMIFYFHISFLLHGCLSFTRAYAMSIWHFHTCWQSRGWLLHTYERHYYIRGWDMTYYSWCHFCT